MGSNCCSDSRNDESASIQKRLKNPKEVAKIKAELTKKFQAADLDSNNYLTYDEFYKLTCDTNLENNVAAPNHAELKQIFAEHDINKDQKLTVDEFVAGSLRQLQKRADERKVK